MVGLSPCGVSHGCLCPSAEGHCFSRGSPWQLFPPGFWKLLFSFNTSCLEGVKPLCFYQSKAAHMSLWPLPPPSLDKQPISLRWSSCEQTSVLCWDPGSTSKIMERIKNGTAHQGADSNPSVFQGYFHSAFWISPSSSSSPVSPSNQLHTWLFNTGVSWSSIKIQIQLWEVSYKPCTLPMKN